MRSMEGCLVDWRALEKPLGDSARFLCGSTPGVLIVFGFEINININTMVPGEDPTDVLKARICLGAMLTKRL